MSQVGGRETKELTTTFWQQTPLHYPILWIRICHSQLIEIWLWYLFNPLLQYIVDHASNTRSN